MSDVLHVITTVQLMAEPFMVSISESTHPNSIASLDPLTTENSISLSSKNYPLGSLNSRRCKTNTQAIDSIVPRG